MKTSKKIIESENGKTTVNYEHLMEYCSRIIPRILKGSTHSREDVQDISHDVYYKIINSKQKFNPEIAKDTTWVYTIARNMCYDLYKKHFFSTHSSLDNNVSSCEEGILTFADLLADDEPLQDRTCNNKQLMKTIYSMRCQMNTMYFDVVICMDYYDLSGKQTAIKLGIDHKAIPTCRRRGKQQLAKLLGNDFEYNFC